MHRVAILLLLFGVVACAKPEVITRYEPGYDFQRLHTFDWIDPEELETPPALAEEEFIDRRIRLTIQEGLHERHFDRVDEDPDFLIIYHAGLESKTEQLPIYGPADQVVGMQTVTYQEGMLVLDVYDEESKDLIWRGWAIEAFQNQENAVRYLPRIVRELVKEFPPKK